MIVEDTFYNVRCDICGEDANPQWWNEKSSAKADAEEANYKFLGGKHYCPDCWEWDDDDNIVTKDGRKFTEDGEEIKEGLL